MRQSQAPSLGRGRAELRGMNDPGRRTNNQMSSGSNAGAYSSYMKPSNKYVFLRRLYNHKDRRPWRELPLTEALVPCQPSGLPFLSLGLFHGLSSFHLPEHFAVDACPHWPPSRGGVHSACVTPASPTNWSPTEACESAPGTELTVNPLLQQLTTTETGIQSNQ